MTTKTTQEPATGSTRRSFLQSTLAAVPAIATLSTPTAAAPRAGTIDVLYEERTALAAQSRELHAAMQAGQPGLQDLIDALSERIETLDEMLGNVPVQVDDISQKAAALLLIGSSLERGPEDMLTYGTTSVLEVLLPCLRGQVRGHAEFVLADVFALMKEMPFWLGELS